MSAPAEIPAIDWEALPSPCYVVDSRLVERNLRIIDTVQRRTGARILLALKGFSMYSLFPLVRRYLRGAAASSLNEARLARECMDREVHVYAPAYTEAEFPTLVRLADHIVFNSFGQWRRFRAAAGGVACGIRINPEYSEVAVDLYNPCRPGSRFGMRRAQFAGEDLDGITGLHFHTLCEQNADVLERTLAVVGERFGDLLARMKWVNMGGGHHISRPDYEVDRLCRLVEAFGNRYDVQVYLEPGEAVALNTGYLVATVLDLFENRQQLAILDTSATAHMPDVLEMPYRPRILGAGEPGELAHTYRLGGLTCLAGDVIGDYSFAQPLQIGQRLVFTDMAHYTMVKNTFFNGVPLPAIARVCEDTGRVRVEREFGYADYKSRLS